MKIIIITSTTAAEVDGRMQDLQRGQIVEVSDRDAETLFTIRHAEPVAAEKPAKTTKPPAGN